MRTMKILLLEETPPRMWRKLDAGVDKFKQYRNTSTHVEKTGIEQDHATAFEKHLHARGENLQKLPVFVYLGRNTSTHVEKTPRYSVGLYK